MKNQYFGDNRDLFKYDLILRVIKETDSIDHFMFIPMLTKNDDTGHGGEDDRDKAKAGTGNDVRNFLDECRREDRRDIKQLESFFKEKAVNITIYKKDEYFSYVWRKEYFEQIGNELLSKSLVFVDPDIGLEVKRTRDKHIRYCEVESLYERMDKSSILMIYQHFPRIHTQNNIQKYFCERSEQLKKIAGDLPLRIDDGETIFFFLTKKNELLRELLGKVISKYGEDYDLRVGVT